MLTPHDLEPNRHRAAPRGLPVVIHRAASGVGSGFRHRETAREPGNAETGRRSASDRLGSIAVALFGYPRSLVAQGALSRPLRGHSALGPEVPWGSVLPRSDWQDVLVSECEFILRALVKEDVSVSQGVKWHAVAPRISEDSSSVMRLQPMGADRAKAKAVELKGTKMHALARARAATLRTRALDVRDSREQFYGHADLQHPMARPPKGEALAPGEPVEPTPEYLAAVAYYRSLAGLFCVFIDEPASESWTGCDLDASCDNEPSGVKSCTHAKPEVEAEGDRTDA